MAWELKGNKGTNPATNFLGTTDNRPLAIRTNGTEHVRVEPSGDVNVNGGDLTVRRFPDNDTTPSLTRIGLVNRSGGGNEASWALYTAAVSGGFGVHPNGFEIWEYPATQPRLRILPGGDTVLAPAGGKVGIGTPPRAPLSINGASATPNVETAEVLHLRRPGAGGVKNSNSAGFRVGAFEAGVSGRTRLDVMLSGGPDNTNGWGDVPDVAVMSLQSDGKVRIPGDIVLEGADCAEEFAVSGTEEGIEPGTVVVIDEGGRLKQSDRAHDQRVAGVISGAGDYRPGLVLDNQAASNGHETRETRMPVALVGKVYCKVDARHSPIEVGDLLTTSTRWAAP